MNINQVYEYYRRLRIIAYHNAGYGNYQSTAAATLKYIKALAKINKLHCIGK